MIFLKRSISKRNLLNTQNECKRVFDLCRQTLDQVPSNILSIDRAISVTEFENFMSRRISKRDSEIHLIFLISNAALFFYSLFKCK